MNKIFKFLVVLTALAVMQGCASSMVKPEDMELERASKYQAVEHNQTVVDNDCVTADAAAMASAMAKADIESGKKMSPAQEKLLMYYYEELKPECMRGKRGASMTGGRYNVSPEQLAWMDQRYYCKRAGLLMRSLQGREISNVLEEGSPMQNLRMILEDCNNSREQDREDYALKRDADLRETIETRNFWGRFIAPYPGHGYYGGSYYRAPVSVRMEWVPVRKKPFNKSRKCKLKGFYQECGSGDYLHRMGGSGHHYTPKVNQNGSLRFGGSGVRQNPSLVYNNTSLRR